MFNLKHFKLVKELTNSKQKINWLQFSSSQNSEKSSLIDSIVSDNKFVEEDMKIRAMVEDMIKKEFPERLKNKKSYEFLVDSVVNKLKQKQMGSLSTMQETDDIVS